ncbi:MAG: hypothetical protein WC777_00775 [Candidatus Gracilibacteria bacterium]|jgi:hypothetical protein
MKDTQKAWEEGEGQIAQPARPLRGLGVQKPAPRRSDWVDHPGMGLDASTETPEEVQAGITAKLKVAQE